ncbi:hypothetical protein GQR58_030135 [Nymphon striatum]|nr:hypothetical protein GQR58_030135 [Nymphon striatum]
MNLLWLLTVVLMIGIHEAATVKELQTKNSTKVKIELFMESLCPDCIKTLINTVYPAYNRVKEITNIEFIPFGNAVVSMRLFLFIKGLQMVPGHSTVNTDRLSAKGIY